MFNTFLRVIFKIVFGVLRFFTNLITIPFTLIFNAIFPDMSNFLASANTFFNDYLIKGVAVGRELFLNITGFPQELITISVDVALAFLGVIASLRIVAFIFNVWGSFRGNTN